MLNPPSPHKYLAINIVDELKRINQTTYKNGYDFHHAITQTILQMNGQYTRYHISSTDSPYCLLTVTFPLTNTTRPDYTFTIISSSSSSDYQYFASIRPYFFLKT